MSKINNVILVFFYIIGLMVAFFWVQNNYFVASYTKKDLYPINKDFYVRDNQHPDIYLYAIKYESFININSDINHIFEILNKKFPNYGIINFLKLYNSFLLFKEGKISANLFFDNLERAKNFHRYSDSFLHIASQAYAQTNNKDKFLVSLGDYFYKNLKYLVGFNLKRENVSIIIVGSNDSGLGIDYTNQKVLIQFSLNDINYLLLNAAEEYSCSNSEVYILKNMSIRFKIFYSDKVSINRENAIASGILKTLSQLTALCQPRSFVF